MRNHVIVILLLAITGVQGYGADVVLRMIRAYGGTNEALPPVVILSAEKGGDIGSSFVTVELDVSAASIPNVYARILHCNADWTPDENGFLSDVNNRTTLIDWKLAPERSKYARYRGILTFPNAQTSIRFSGNWLVQVFDLDNDSLIGETRIFAVDTRAVVRMNFMTDF